MGSWPADWRRVMEAGERVGRGRGLYGRDILGGWVMKTELSEGAVRHGCEMRV